MRKVFIADAHLKSITDQNYRILLRFLDELPGNTDTLFILGDLFEFWIGYPPEAFPHYKPVLDALLRLRTHGVELVYFEGNHDFHMGLFFEEKLKANIHTGPGIVMLGNKRACLCHGDQINTRDHGYRLLRLLFHSSLTKALTKIVPASLVLAIGKTLGTRSKAQHGERRTRWDYPSIIREFAASRFSEGCDLVITGHFHLPLLETSGQDQQKILVSLGDWITHFTYAEWENNTISLKTYR
jgi:UDP-2,3-diacylglucosamine hydrolase